MKIITSTCGTFWRPARDSLKVSVQVGAKMGARWPKLRPSWQQVATKMGQDSPKLAMSGSTWEFLGACWEHFGTILAHGLDSRKPTKRKENKSFLVFWDAWEGAMLARKSGLGAVL